MILLHSLGQPFGLHMGVDLGGGNIGMAQHLLHRAQIRAMRQQSRSKGMPEHVGRNFLGIKPGGAGQRFQLQRKMLPCQRPAYAMRRKQPVGYLV